MLEALLSGLGLGLVLALSVGPVIFTVLKQSINNGKEGGFAFVTGVWISDIVLVTISNIFSELVHTLLRYERLIASVGGAFLLAMGIYYVFFKKVMARDAAGANVAVFGRKDFTRVALSGFLINTLNPGVFIFWLGAATAFSAKYPFDLRVILFGACISINILADVGKVLMAGKLRKRLTTHNISIINKISGSILIAFALVLFWGVVFFKMPQLH